MPISFLISAQDREEIGSKDLDILSIAYSDFFNIKGEVELSLADLDAIRDLNLKYRALDEPTDVLSFPTFQNLSEIELVPQEITPLLGSVVICPAKAVLYNETLPQLVHHGLLHILGHDHETDSAAWHTVEASILTNLKTAGLIIQGVPDDSL